MQKGQAEEIEASYYLHQRGAPILVSDKLLRENGGGQIDIARYLWDTKTFEIIEVKSSGRLGAAQRKRLFQASFFLKNLLDGELSLSLLDLKYASRKKRSLPYEKCLINLGLW